MEAIISYQKPIATFKVLLAVSAVILGIVAIVTGAFMGFIFMAIGLAMITREGSQINLSSKQFRTFYSLFGLKIGKWQEIPDFEYVSVFKTKESQTIRVVTAETKQQYNIIYVNLFYDRNKHITFFKTIDKKEAFEVAQHFKEALEIDILDATEPEKKWM